MARSPPCRRSPPTPHPRARSLHRRPARDLRQSRPSGRHCPLRWHRYSRPPAATSTASRRTAAAAAAGPRLVPRRLQPQGTCRAMQKFKRFLLDEVGADMHLPGASAFAAVTRVEYRQGDGLLRGWKYRGDASPSGAVRRVSRRASSTGSVTDQSRSCNRHPGVGLPCTLPFADATVDSPRDCRQHSSRHLIDLPGRSLAGEVSSSR